MGYKICLRRKLISHIKLATHSIYPSIFYCCSTCFYCPTTMLSPRSPFFIFIFILVVRIIVTLPCIIYIFNKYVEIINRVRGYIVLVYVPAKCSIRFSLRSFLLVNNCVLTHMVLICPLLRLFNGIIVNHNVRCINVNKSVQYQFDLISIDFLLTF